ncbi:hypothetical protein EVAR_57165_1 [Eumeta japonica]|uniref:Uncharacterized protein n=1 Tax=Eumeta variegata TaxID=151549 RepID=A0A4C1YW33_EUMVA|nr:hypothetical protein EVAR_57165_1 [Eumeta japonica]
MKRILRSTKKNTKTYVEFIETQYNLFLICSFVLPAAQLRLATRVSSPFHTNHAAYAADRRPSNIWVPPFAAVKSARITDPFHADVTAHAAATSQMIHAFNSSSRGSTRQRGIPWPLGPRQGGQSSREVSPEASVRDIISLPRCSGGRRCDLYGTFSYAEMPGVFVTSIALTGAVVFRRIEGFKLLSPPYASPVLVVDCSPSSPM